MSKEQKKILLSKGNMTKEFNEKDAPYLIKDGWKEADEGQEDSGDSQEEEIDKLDSIIAYINDNGFKARAEILVKDAKKSLGFTVSSEDLDSAWSLIE